MTNMQEDSGFGVASVGGVGGGGGNFVTSGTIYVTNVATKTEMSVAEQVVKQRADVKERARVNASLDEYAAAGFDELDDGAVIAWSSDVAIYDDGRGEWKSTVNYKGPSGSTEQLITWLIEHKINASDVSILRGWPEDVPATPPSSEPPA